VLKTKKKGLLIFKTPHLKTSPEREEPKEKRKIEISFPTKIKRLSKGTMIQAFRVYERLSKYEKKKGKEGAEGMKS